MGRKYTQNDYTRATAKELREYVLRDAQLDITTLTSDDIGKWVAYTGTYPYERGRIKSWNMETVFVVYNCNNDWDNFQNYTASGTSPKDLITLYDK